jgi:hypothetical protein
MVIIKVYWAQTAAGACNEAALFLKPMHGEQLKQLSK